MLPWHPARHSRQLACVASQSAAVLCKLANIHAALDQLSGKLSGQLPAFSRCHDQLSVKLPAEAWRAASSGTQARCFDGCQGSGPEDLSSHHLFPPLATPALGRKVMDDHQVRFPWDQGLAIRSNPRGSDAFCPFLAPVSSSLARGSRHFQDSSRRISPAHELMLAEQQWSPGSVSTARGMGAQRYQASLSRSKMIQRMKEEERERRQARAKASRVRGLRQQQQQQQEETQAESAAWGDGGWGQQGGGGAGGGGDGRGEKEGVMPQEVSEWMQKARQKWADLSNLRLPGSDGPATSDGKKPGTEAQGGAGLEKKLFSFFEAQERGARPELQPSHGVVVQERLEGALRPRNEAEARLAPLLARSDLIVTRNVEWMNILVGFEQENRYIIVDGQSGQTAGQIIERSHWLMRQFLRTRRHFQASIEDAFGRTLFTIRRPFFLVSSTIYVEMDGEVVGQVHRRWHLWRRVYDAYIGKRQFAEVNNAGFWWWTFDLRDADGGLLAQVDRNWRGLGFELFTDAGQYVIRFGSQSLPYGSTHPSALSSSEIPVLDVVRPLSLTERAVCLALAVSLDNDYFSRHSNRGGSFIPYIGEDWA